MYAAERAYREASINWDEAVLRLHHAHGMVWKEGSVHVLPADKIPDQSLPPYFNRKRFVDGSCVLLRPTLKLDTLKRDHVLALVIEACKGHTRQASLQVWARYVAASELLARKAVCVMLNGKLCAFRNWSP